MQTILTVFHIFLAIGLVGLILIQHGKGADMGAAFGSGASGTVFGAKGSASFLTRTTAILATLFFITSIAMGYLVSQSNKPVGVMDEFQEAPAVPAPQAPQSDTSSIPAKRNGPVPTAEVTGESAEKIAPQTGEKGPKVPAAAQQQSAQPETPGTESETPPDDTSTVTTVPAQAVQQGQNEQQ